MQNQDKTFKTVKDGELHFKTFKVDDLLNVIDIMAADWRFSFEGALDFTEDNGKPDSKSFLHVSDEKSDSPNPYKMLLDRIVGVIEQYQ